jgi:hypothetical protein
MGIMKRGRLVIVFADKSGKFSIQDKNGKSILSSDTDFHVYFKDAVFNDSGYIEAVYLGRTEGKLLDDYCKAVSFTKEDGWLDNSKRKVSKCNMISVSNSIGAYIIHGDN